jgi:hypothetical protein
VRQHPLLGTVVEVDKPSSDLCAVMAAASEWQQRSGGSFNPLAGELSAMEADPGLAALVQIRHGCDPPLLLHPQFVGGIIQLEEEVGGVTRVPIRDGCALCPALRFDALAR